MNGAWSLLALAAVLAFAAPRWLERASWLVRAPGLGIVAWLTVLTATWMSLILAGIAMAVPGIPAHDGVVDLFHACSAALQGHASASGGGLALAGVGVLLTTYLFTRLCLALTREVARSRRVRRRHRQLVRDACISSSAADVAIVASPDPLVYCIPGRRGQIVVTEGAMRVLSPSQLEAVLAHERGHLRSQHHRSVQVAAALSAALGRLLGKNRARYAVQSLCEMHADDAASMSHRKELARALVLLALTPSPTGALAAAGQQGATGTVARIRRLGAPVDPVKRRERVGISMGLAVLSTLPLALAMGPSLTGVVLGFCPIFL